MSELKDWDPDLIPTNPSWRALFEAQKAVNDALLSRNRDLLSKAEDDRALIQSLNAQLKERKRDTEREFMLIKRDAIATLRAINLMLLSSLCSDGHWLTHRARNFRLKHIAEICANAISQFDGKSFPSWDDDF